MKQRIWELDAFRGLCILGMVVVHLVYDLTDLYRIIHWTPPAAFLFIQNWGGVLFLLLSGICATLGRRSFRRGLIVFACGMLCTAVTGGMYLLSFSGPEIVIRFGVLHCLGLCMILWSVFKKLPVWGLALCGVIFIGAGFLFRGIPVESPWLFPLGLLRPDFMSSDYFPLLPNFGFFLTGALLGRTLYRNKTTLLPQVDPRFPPLRFLGFCGRQSLFIYLLHQPVLSLVCQILSLV